MTPQEIERCNKIAFRLCQKRNVMYLLDDATQSAYIAFWQAKERYDGRDGVELFAYAHTRVKGAVKDYIRTHHFRAGAVHKPSAKAFSSMEEPLRVVGHDMPIKVKDLLGVPAEVERTIQDEADSERAGKLMDSLPERWKEVIRRKFWGEQTLKSIGKDMGFTEVRAGQLLHRSLAKMREAA